MQIPDNEVKKELTEIVLGLSGDEWALCLHCAISCVCQCTSQLISSFQEKASSYENVLLQELLFLSPFSFWSGKKGGEGNHKVIFFQPLPWWLKVHRKWLLHNWPDHWWLFPAGTQKWINYSKNRMIWWVVFLKKSLAFLWIQAEWILRIRLYFRGEKKARDLV